METSHSLKSPALAAEERVLLEDSGGSSGDLGWERSRRKDGALVWVSPGTRTSGWKKSDQEALICKIYQQSRMMFEDNCYLFHILPFVSALRDSKGCHPLSMTAFDALERKTEEALSAWGPRRNNDVFYPS